VTAAEAQAVRNEELQAALVREDVWYQDLFGPPSGWSETVRGEYLRDLYLTRRRHEDWVVDVDAALAEAAACRAHIEAVNARSDANRRRRAAVLESVR
jgi:hypothetical protein